MTLSLLAAHAGRDKYSGTSLIQVILLCAIVWKRTVRMRAMPQEPVRFVDIVSPQFNWNEDEDPDAY
jgi:hypothetical protein